MRTTVPFLWLVATAWGAEIRDVWTSARIDTALGSKRVVHVRPNWRVRVDSVKANWTGKNDGFDQVAWVRRGSGRLIIGNDDHEVAAGDLIHIGRGVLHQWRPRSGPLAFVSVEVLASGENLPARNGFLAPRLMPAVLKKAAIHDTIARHDSNQPLHSGRNFTINYVIYKNRPGPWEAHKGCVDVYFIQHGTGRAELGGEILGAREESPGEIRGSGVRGSRVHRIGPGDMVVIPRDGSHHMQPLDGKLAYLLMKVWVD